MLPIRKKMCGSQWEFCHPKSKSIPSASPICVRPRENCWDPSLGRGTAEKSPARTKSSCANARHSIRWIYIKWSYTKLRYHKLSLERKLAHIYRYLTMNWSGAVARCISDMQSDFAARSCDLYSTFGLSSMARWWVSYFGSVWKRSLCLRDFWENVTLAYTGIARLISTALITQRYDIGWSDIKTLDINGTEKLLTKTVTLGLLTRSPHSMCLDRKWVFR